MDAVVVVVVSVVVVVDADDGSSGSEPMRLLLTLSLTAARPSATVICHNVLFSVFRPRFFIAANSLKDLGRNEAEGEVEDVDDVEGDVESLSRFRLPSISRVLLPLW